MGNQKATSKIRIVTLKNHPKQIRNNRTVFQRKHTNLKVIYISYQLDENVDENGLKKKEVYQFTVLLKRLVRCQILALEHNDSLNP